MKKVLLGIALIFIFGILFIFSKMDQKEIINFNLLKDYKNFQGISTDLNNGWMLYKNDVLGFQFEYPSRKFTHGVLKPYENKYVNMPGLDKSLLYDISFSDSMHYPSQGDLLRITIQIEQSYFKNIDEYFTWTSTRYESQDELYYKTMTISESDAVLISNKKRDTERTSNNEGLDNVVVIKNGVLVNILTAYLTQEEREHIWKSFQFLK